MALDAVDAPLERALARGADGMDASLEPSGVRGNVTQQQGETPWSRGAVISRADVPRGWPNGSAVEEDWSAARTCGTSGCTLPTVHEGACSGHQLAGSRRKRPPERLQAALASQYADLVKRS